MAAWDRYVCIIHPVHAQLFAVFSALESPEVTNPEDVYSLWKGLEKEGWVFEPLLPPGWRRR